MLNDTTASEKIALLAPSLPKGFVKAPPASMEEGVRFISTTTMAEDDDGNS